MGGGVEGGWTGAHAMLMLMLLLMHIHMYPSRSSQLQQLQRMQQTPSLHQGCYQSVCTHQQAPIITHLPPPSYQHHPCTILLPTPLPPCLPCCRPC